MRTLKKHTYLILSALMLVVLVIHVCVLHYIPLFSWPVAIQDGIVSTAILSVAIWGIVLLINAYPTTAALILYALFVALLISGVVCLAEYETLKWMLNVDDSGYQVWLLHTLPVRFIIIALFNIWIASTTALRKNMAELDSRFQQQTDASILLKEAELFKLRQQLQPHFLYNSLNSISALIMIAPDRAQDMVGKLSDFLRSSVKRESEDVLPIAEELLYIQSYLSIESVRFGDRLQVQFVQDFVDHSMIPPFLLQPIIENAIKFGLYGNTGIVKITVNIVLEGNMLLLTITNPFDPNMQPPKGTGFGFAGIQRRLYLLYARTDLLETQKDEQNFTTILKIPQHYVQSNTDR